MKRYVVTGSLFEREYWVKDEEMADEQYRFKVSAVLRCWMLNREEGKWKRMNKLMYWYYEVKDTKTNKIVYPGAGEG